MTYEELIITIDSEAPYLSNIAYKLLWRLIALAMSRGTTVIHISQRWLAGELRRSKESIANGTDELAKVIEVSRPDGHITTYSLPPEWFPPQRTLFSDDQLGGVIHNRPGNQATTDPETRPLLTWKPGHHRPGNQATWAENQAASGRETRPRDTETRPGWAGNQATSHDGAREDSRARVRSIESEASASSKVVAVIDRAWGAVDIPEGREADAALLSDWLYAYKCDLGPLAEHSTYTDTAMLARILELAPLEEIHQVLRSLREEGKECGNADAWFFTVLAQRIHHVSPKLVGSRMAAGKSKPLAKNGNPSLFAADLVKRTNAAVRRIG